MFVLVYVWLDVYISSGAQWAWMHQNLAKGQNLTCVVRVSIWKTIAHSLIMCKLLHVQAGLCYAWQLEVGVHWSTALEGCLMFHGVICAVILTTFCGLQTCVMSQTIEWIKYFSSWHWILYVCQLTCCVSEDFYWSVKNEASCKMAIFPVGYKFTSTFQLLSWIVWY
jgi:hypothetical protein